MMQGILGINGTYGPMATDVDSLVMTMKLIWQKESIMFWDPFTVPLPFDYDTFQADRPLTIGYYTGTSHFEVRVLLHAHNTGSP